MRKSDKKVEKQLRMTLAQICESTLKDISGFRWITHSVNYNDFPNSLKIVCQFEENEQLTIFMENKQNLEVNELIEKQLLAINIVLKNISKHIRYTC